MSLLRLIFTQWLTKPLDVISACLSYFVSSHVLNEDQMTIIRHIVAESDGYTPPLIIYGSFGTGKSETLAQATMLLLKQRPNARILLCTHSNRSVSRGTVYH